MMEQYRKTMDNLTLSDAAVSQFYKKLEGASVKKRHYRLRPALAAACLCLLIPLAVYAASSIFGQPKSELITNPTRAGKGYVTSIGSTYPRAIADFAPELQTLNDSARTDFSSWQEAEEYIGFTLLDAPALFSGDFDKYKMVLTADGKSHSYHCLTSFVGDGQLLMGHAEAYYQKNYIRVALRATIAADHPEMDEEMLEFIHSGSAFYPGNQVGKITTENITTQAGLPVCVTTVQMAKYDACDYEATFFINGVSFTLRVAGHGVRHNEEAKALLLEILESIRV